MLLKIRYVLRVLKPDGHLFNIFYIKNIDDMVRISLVKDIEQADSLQHLADAYYAQKKMNRLLEHDVEIMKVKIEYEVETVPKEEIRAAILNAAKSKLTQEEFAAIQYHTLPNKYHKEYEND